MATYSIKAAASKVGLTTYLIRAWENRYEAIKPQRTTTNRRIYTEEDIERLRLLKKATNAGAKISHVAQLTNEELIEYLADREADSRYQQTDISSVNDLANELIEKSLNALKKSDFDNLESLLFKATASLSIPSLLGNFLSPLLEMIGQLWQRGEMRIADEHRTSSLIRTFLGSILDSRQNKASAKLVVATPAGQRHEFGALMAAIIAESIGWQVIYIGADLPAEEIANIVNRHQAIALALSIVYSSEDLFLGEELLRLRKLIGKDVKIIVGGRAASDYSSYLEKISAKRVSDLFGLRDELSSH